MSAHMSVSALRLQRLLNQRLAGNPLASAADVVAWFGGVQAQEYGLAKWALGLRTVGAVDADVEAAFGRGDMLRTHVLRPTWHFVSPRDIRWMLRLTGPRVQRLNAGMYRQTGLDARVLARGADRMARALEGGKYLTRRELADMLRRARIDPGDTVRLAYIMMYAELEGVVCSGPRRGQTHTYALVAERAPAAGAAQLDHDEALAELARRYFTSHGPATLADLGWWSGLTMADGRQGVAIAGKSLRSVTVDGREYWTGDRERAVDRAAARRLRAAAHLLPIYDEFGISYKDRSAHAERGGSRPPSTGFVSPFTVGGECLGVWRRTIGRHAVAVELEPFRRFRPVEQAAFAAAAARFAAFLGTDLHL